MRKFIEDFIRWCEKREIAPGSELEQLCEQAKLILPRLKQIEYFNKEIETFI